MATTVQPIDARKVRIPYVKRSSDMNLALNSSRIIAARHKIENR